MWFSLLLAEGHQRPSSRAAKNPRFCPSRRTPKGRNNEWRTPTWRRCAVLGGGGRKTPSEGRGCPGRREKEPCPLFGQSRTRLKERQTSLRLEDGHRDRRNRAEGLQTKAQDGKGRGSRLRSAPPPHRRQGSGKTMGAAAREDAKPQKQLFDRIPGGGHLLPESAGGAIRNVRRRGGRRRLTTKDDRCRQAGGRDQRFCCKVSSLPARSRSETAAIALSVVIG